MSEIGQAPAQQSNFKPIPAVDAGSYPAYCTTVALLGEFDQRPFPGDPKEKPPCVELLFSFELAGETWETEEGEDRPRIISNTVTYKGGERAKLTKYREAIDPTGSLSDEGKKLSGLLGQLCSVELTKKEGKNSTPQVPDFRNYINGLSPKPNLKGYTFPDLVSETILFNAADPVWADFQKLPRWVQKKCKEANDYPGSKLEALVAENEVVSEDTDGSAGTTKHRI